MAFTGKQFISDDYYYFYLLPCYTQATVLFVIQNDSYKYNGSFGNYREHARTPS